MLGVPADEARDICRRPLPDLDDPSAPNPRLPQGAEHSPGPPARPTPVTTRRRKRAHAWPSRRRMHAVTEEARVRPRSSRRVWRPMRLERPASARAARLFRRRPVGCRRKLGKGSGGWTSRPIPEAGDRRLPPHVPPLAGRWNLL